MDAFERAFAGLLVVYAPIAFRENDRFEMMAIDNYQFPFDDFAQQVQRARQQMDDARAEECWLIIGTPARVSRLEASIRTTIQTSFNSVLEGAEIAKASLHEGDLLTVDMRKQFFLQQIFAEDGVRYPLAVRRELEEELWALCLYAAAHSEANSPTAEIVLEQWIQREQPWRMGKQPMIRSYFNRKLEWRQIIACIADPTTGAWTQLLEGGLGIAMDGTYTSKNMAQQIDRFRQGLYLKYATILHTLTERPSPRSY